MKLGTECDRYGTPTDAELRSTFTPSDKWEEFLCNSCTGSGEGRFEHSVCHSCKGTGTEYVLVQADPFDEYEADE